MQSRNHWEQVYTTKDASGVSWYQDHPRLSLALIRRASISTDSSIIDVGGGASVLVDALLDEGYADVTVLDLSAAGLAASRK